MTKESFKPYYNWNTFNTMEKIKQKYGRSISFKPYYNWNTFNTPDFISDEEYVRKF